MCIENLPIEFDAAGNATLKPGAVDPYSSRETRLQTPIEDDPHRMKELFKRNGPVRRVYFDPVTPCTTHLHMDDRTMTREIISCACGSDGTHTHQGGAR